MLTITERAANQIRVARQADATGMALRIAASREPDGSIAYTMGFDDAQAQDTRITVHGVEVVVGITSVELLQGAVLDYVELEPGDFRFIFMNPNDPHYVPPTRDGT